MIYNSTRTKYVTVGILVDFRISHYQPRTASKICEGLKVEDLHSKKVNYSQGEDLKLADTMMSPFYNRG